MIIEQEEFQKKLKRINLAYFSDPDRIIAISRGNSVVRQGEQNKRLYLILSGSVVSYRHVVKEDPETASTSHKIYKAFRAGPGDYLGVQSFFSGWFRSSSDLIAETDLELAYIDTATPAVDVEHYGTLLEQFVPAIVHELAARNTRVFDRTAEKEEALRALDVLPDENGILIINSDIRDYREICDGLPIKVITVGSDPEKSHYSAADVTFNENACATYTLLEDGKAIDTITLGVPGIHNVYNSLAAIAAAHELGIRGDGIRNGLLRFTGTHRRFEKKGMIGGVTVIDDYAHHPQEIAATLAAAKNYPHREIWCVFQPHTYTRTKALMDDFAKSLSAADHVVLADIYAARETDNLGISSGTLAEKIAALGTDTHYFPSFDAIETFLLENCVNGDLLITMGAGDIVKVGEKLLGQ